MVNDEDENEEDYYDDDIGFLSLLTGFGKAQDSPEWTSLRHRRVDVSFNH